MSLQDNSLGALSSQSRAVLSRMKSLQMVNQECYSQVMARLHVESRKSSETTSTELSGGMEPPSIAGRGVSVLTAATSVTSGRFSPSDKSSSPTDTISISNRSWVDLELNPNNNLDHDHDHSTSAKPENSTSQKQQGNNNCNKTALQNTERSRSLGNIDPPPIPPRFRPDLNLDSRSMSMGYKQARAAAVDPFSAFSSPTKSFTSAAHPRASHVFEGVRIKQPTEFPARRSSLNANKEFLSLPSRHLAPRSPSSPKQAIPSHISYLSPNVAPTEAPPPPPSRAPEYQQEEEARSILSFSDDEDEEESDTMMDMALLTPKDKQGIATPTIISPLADIERWVDQSSIELSHLPQLAKDYQGSRIPITPEVLDTLRISVACFPETMLLCSSLSIETLRGNAKKIRYRIPNAHPGSQLSLNLPEEPAKTSKWKWLSTKRMPDPSPTKLPSRKSHMELSAAVTNSQLQAPDWQAIKNIFPKGTDHLCDALYAHVLAYNYISTLCPRSAVVAPAARPSTQQSSHPSISETSSIHSSIHSSIRPNGNSIPLKAASLLGLQNDPSTTIASPRDVPGVSKPNTLRGKASFIRKRENAKSFGPVATRSSDDHDLSLKDLRLGLAKCIARLIGTLRLTSNEDMGTSAKPVDVRDIDPLFIRALCEVVRCNEEG